MSVETHPADRGEKSILRAERPLKKPIFWPEALAWGFGVLAFVLYAFAGDLQVLVLRSFYGVVLAATMGLATWALRRRGPVAFRLTALGKWSTRAALAVAWAVIAFPIAFVAMISLPPIPVGLEVFESADSERARHKFEEIIEPILERSEADQVTDVYARSIYFRDSSETLRFRVRDASLVDELVASLQLEETSCEGRSSLRPLWWTPPTSSLHGRCYERSDSNDYWRLAVDENSIVYFQTGDF